MKSATAENAIQLLKDDHKKVKDLFSKYEKTEDGEEKQEIANAAIKELKIHSIIEEEIFYPAIRKSTGDNFLVNEAEEEHHVVKVLIGELEDITTHDERFDAKFTVLAENVRHHIKEEESEMLPEAKKSGINLDEMGFELIQRKEELETEVEAIELREDKDPKGSDSDEDEDLE